MINRTGISAPRPLIGPFSGAVTNQPLSHNLLTPADGKANTRHETVRARGTRHLQPRSQGGNGADGGGEVR